MKCSKCKKESEIKLTHLRDLCKTCFLFTIEKRIRKELRQKASVKRNEKLAIIDDGSKEAKILNYFLKNILKDMPIEIFFVKKLDGKYDKLFAPHNANQEADLFLQYIFDNKITQNKGVKLLKVVSAEEMSIIADILEFSGIERDLKYSGLLDKFEKKYPGTVFSIVKSIEIIENISKN